ncbi:hypothetical protein [Zeimonas arvi]|uniref:UrcA family protein n=1 Tax=Zeimonas arvi TaxID=2498847 RepID=A0A5C8NUA2_9BURK|nr:hypothetical protein [Zeimonas arvi]TXL64738.1 hypothetical protein FHP08_13430 [Zeimonas arvi]
MTVNARFPFRVRRTLPAAMRLVSTLIATAACSAALAADPPAGNATADGIEAEYQRNRALCLAGLTHQARSDCLREAGAARDEARRARLGNGHPPSEYLENALKRCLRLPDADRSDCEARVRGEGAQRGSVESGGIYRETRTLLPPASQTD